uniref:Putative salivary secreted peptide n=1 Tax=Ixodes ricinus TaxID=34613 RepID=V5GIY1_IXORI
MMVVIAALVLASFISCTSAGAEKPKISDGPALTIGYLLYKPKVKDEPEVTDVTWEIKFNSSLGKVHKYAEAWLRRYIFVPLKLQTWNITAVDREMKSKIRQSGKE